MASDENRLYIVDKVRAELPTRKGLVPKPVRSWIFRTRKAAREFQRAKQLRAKKPLAFIYPVRPAVWGPDNIE